MLKAEEGVYCGVFDSRILRKTQTKSPDRTVKCYEIELFHNASGVSYVDAGKYPVRRGMLLCAKPGQIRHSDFPVRCSFIRVIPGEGGDSDVEKVLRALPDCTYLENENDVNEMMALFTRLSMCFVGASPQPLNELRINALFFDILYRVARLCRGQMELKASAPAGRIAREAYEYINEHFREDCSLPILAEAVRISPNHLHAVFHRDVGMTPLEYTMLKRISQARKLIMAGEMSMLEIALETGFCSQSHFNKVFRKQTGMTPVEYRKKLLEQYVESI